MGRLMRIQKAQFREPFPNDGQNKNDRHTIQLFINYCAKSFWTVFSDIPSTYENKVEFCGLSSGHLCWSLGVCKFAQTVLSNFEKIDSKHNLQFNWRPVLFLLTALHANIGENGEGKFEGNEINRGLWTPKIKENFGQKLLKALLYATVGNVSTGESEDQRLLEQWPVIMLRLVQLEKISEKYSVILDSMAMSGKFNFLR
uniref:Uncharacterized protein n=1 Tax=Meloidogyne hapla TaxID=6305 RepID=A0A1I8C3S7_MELHA